MGGVVALVVGCESIDPADCDRFETKHACERADAEPDGCFWLEVREPTVVDDACAADPSSHGECIGYVLGTEQGCSAIECGGEQGESVFFQIVDDRVQTFVSPHCGGGPVTGDWQSCGLGSDAPAECGCACAP